MQEKGLSRGVVDYLRALGFPSLDMGGFFLGTRESPRVEEGWVLK